MIDAVGAPASVLVLGGASELGEAIEDFDAVATASHAELVTRVFGGGDIDVVIVAAGVLPDQTAAFADPGIAVDAALANYVGPMSVSLHAAHRLRAQGHGLLIVLSSVAAERPRRANYVYGSTKAGLDAFATGLGDDLHGSGVRVMVVRPGFVTGRMTAGMKAAPMATTPAAVADAVAANITAATGTVWVPGGLRYAMSVLRHLPRAIFRRLPQ